MHMFLNKQEESFDMFFMSIRFVYVNVICLLNFLRYGKLEYMSIVHINSFSTNWVNFYKQD